MLKALIRKQLAECFRFYFLNRKTGKAHKRSGTVIRFVFFGLIMLVVCGISFMISYALQKVLFNGRQELNWLYFTVMGSASILLGIIGSVFNTYASLYLPKDNELLMAMPIPPTYILLSRLTVVLLLSLLYSGVVWVPALLCICVAGHASAPGVVFGILLTIVIALFVSVVTCLLGWLIALIASRIRSKRGLILVISFGCLGAYLYFCMRMSDMIESFAVNITKIAAGFSKWGGLLYELGRAGTGDVLGMAVFTAVSIAASAVCFILLSRNYSVLLMGMRSDGKAKKKKHSIKVHGIRAALFRRDMQRMGASVTYMMNACFGVLLMPVLTVLLLIYLPKARGFLQMGYIMWPPLRGLVPACVPAAVALVAGMDCISLPSVSLEGKDLWILQTMPVTGWQILRSKRDVHILLNSVPALILCAAADICIGASVLTAAASVLFVLTFILFNADLGLIFGLRHADLNWTSEIAVIKQNVLVPLLMLIGIACMLLVGGCVWILRGMVSPMVIITVFAVIFAAAALIMEKWLKTKGSVILQSL